ncbi:tipN [Asticcacaulis solisilvae]|uniref:tipN n=1 Tax=Asticcacaulis solisilvae TaxID=1217274 RepID=UPI003FD85188
MDVPEAQSEIAEGEDVSEDNAADDLLEAPLTEKVAEAAPEAGPEAQPEPTSVTPELDRAEDAFFIPEAAAAADLPPIASEGLPPARREKSAPTPEKTGSRNVPVRKVETEGVLKATGASPVVFWGTVTFISVLWACGMTAFVLAAQNNLTAFAAAPVRIIVLGFLALFPTALIFASAFALRSAAALSRQSARAAALADSMLAPAASAAMQTNELVDALRSQVDHAVRAVRLAHNDVAELSAKLKAETERLQDAAQIARATTNSVTRSIEHERVAVQQMSAQLSDQSNGIIEAVDRQARMIADASDLAQTQLREAEATLAVRSSDMMTAATDVSSTARKVSEDLDRQTQRLEAAGSGVADQIRVVEEGLSQQRAGLVSAALSLRADQEDFAVHIENQRAQLTEALAITRVATVDLGETSARGVDVLRDIVLSAQENFRGVMNAAENERTAFETRIHATLSNISVMAADARDDLIAETRRSLEQLITAAAETKKAADTAAQVAQQRVDRLNETIFEASKKADEVFDARFNAARRLIEDSAGLIIEAGDQTAEKLDASFEHTRQTIAEVNEALNELTASADQLPLMAQDRLHDIRKSVEDGLSAMTAAARKAALETEAVDQAFQERVRRNYDMLTEAVRLMGVISGGEGGNRQAVTAPPAMPRPVPPTPQAAPAQPAPQPERARLRLSPISAESRPSPQPQRPAPQGSRAGESNGWSWRDLLNGMDSNGQPMQAQPAAQPQIQPSAAPLPPADADFDNLDDMMVGEVSAMGVDAQALLSRSRIDEAILAIMSEDNEGARNLVRRVAPAAIRRLSRRLVSDPVLRQQANDFTTAYDQQINIALMSKDVARGLQEVLGNDRGRAYLLVDAAIADLI